MYGLGYLLDSLLFWLGYFHFPESSPRYYLVAGLSHLLVGAYLIRGAPHLVRFAYPEEEDNESQDEHENQEQEISDLEREDSRAAKQEEERL